MEENNEVIQEFYRGNPIANNQVIEEYSRENNMAILDKISELYRLREKVGTEHTFGDLETRADHLKALQDIDAEKLNRLSKEIDAMAKERGIEFDSKTGQLSNIAEERNQNGKNVEQDKNLERVQTDFDTVSTEYSNVTNALYGKNENQEKEQESEEKKKNPGVIEAIKERKLNIMERDADAKKILQELVKVQAAKDRLDMHMARHVVEKNRLMMQIMQIKLQLIAEISRGARRNDMKIQILEVQLNGLVNAVSKKETEFEQMRGGLMSEFNGARSALSEAKKTLEVDQAGSGARNKYSVSYSYSEDGVMNGAQLDGRKDDKTIHEKEVYDERGIMVYDNMDTINGQVSIMVDGKIVNIVSEYSGNGEDVNDIAYMEGMEAMEASSNGIVEEKPDVNELQIPEKTAEEIKLASSKRNNGELKYIIDGIEYRTLMEIPAEERNRVVRAMAALEIIQNGNVVAPALAETRGLMQEAIAKDQENELEEEEEHPGFPPRPVF